MIYWVVKFGVSLSWLGICICVLGCSPTEQEPVRSDTGQQSPEKKEASTPPAGKLKVLEPGMHRESIDVPDVGDVKFAVRVDESYDSSTPAPLVLVLHFGYNGAKPDPYTGGDMIGAFMGAVREIGGIAIAPDVVGGDWTTTENENSAVWLVKSAMNSYNIDPKQVYVTGYSMGGEGTWHIAGRHQDLFTGAIPVAAPVTGTTDWKIPVFSIHSSKDSIVPYANAKNHAAAIKSAGGTIQFKTAPGLSHYDAGGYSSHVTEGVKWIRSQ